ncbi:hypothetical protein D9758_002867 [Tetrapyrgos nigripes]|uniref:Uncharacterized protein n=1 Tax=Tetrapyrgos nigripes TaxID=182062 RepID=A0A8H5LTI3_9AGAR|nr:hypothetical protein D9758_002867 [Tetrapyrgos nigripes]
MQHLGHEQRTRLIKSTRKLGAVLGTVPTIQIDQPTDRPTHKVSLSLAPSSGASLVLRVQAAVNGPSSQTPSPLSPTFSLNSDVPKRSSSLPTGPSYHVRRQKMAKLTRTLGENVPPELVFPDAGSSSETRPRRARSCSIDSIIIIHSPSTATTPVSFDCLDSYDGEKSISTTLLDRKPSMKEKEKQPSTRARALVRSASGRKRSHSNFRSRPVPGRSKEGSTVAVQSSYYASPFGNDEPFSGESWTIVDGQTQNGLLAETTTHKKGREWSGQWNRDDIEEVAMKLRQLKFK